MQTSNLPLIGVRELTVRLSTGQLAVDRVSFAIKRGECLSLVGESGCGKTLTALSLLKAVPREAGQSCASSIQLEGTELTKLSDKKMRPVRGGRISMIFQDPAAALNPLFTVGSQIVEAIGAHMRTSSKEAVQRARSALAEAGLVETGRVFGSYSHQLSGGQCQRATIALALATRPLLLIADEPTTALDVTVQRQILDLLKRLKEERGLALLLITHNLSVVAQLADRVLIMYAGHIVEGACSGKIFSAAAHPYTRALLDCLPSIEKRREEPATIPGSVPQPGSWPAGCRFRPRCEFAGPGCESDQSLEPLQQDGSHTVRCRLAGKLFGKAQSSRGA